MRLLSFLLLVLLPAQVLAATVYIDPSCPNSGDGTTTVCGANGGTGPYKLWSSVTWTAGNTYAGKGGTTASESVTVGATGTAGNVITVTSYGTGQHTISSAGGTAITAIDRSYLTITNMKFATGTGHGIDIQSSGAVSNLTITNNTFNTVKQHGIKMGSNDNASVISTVMITGNSFTSIGLGGITYPQIPAGNSGIWSDHMISDNYFTTVGRDGALPAIDMLMIGGTTAKYLRVQIERNTIENCNNSYTSNPSIIRLGRSPAGSAIELRFDTVTIRDNSIGSTRQGAIEVAHVGGASVIARNGFDDIDSNAALAVFWSREVVIEANVISNIRPLLESSSIDGMGLDLEDNTGLIVRRNRVATSLGATGVPNSGQGIYNFSCNACFVYANLLIGNKNGLHVYGSTDMTVPSIYAHNTVVNSTQYGAWLSWTASYRQVLINNVVSGSGVYGVRDEGSGGTLSTLTTNLVFGSGTADYSGATHASDINANPLLTDWYKTQGSSPARRAGTLTSTCLDFRGRPCMTHPDLGAYQAGSGDPAAPRLPLTQPRAARQ
jgi:hypothetical protein